MIEYEARQSQDPQQNRLEVRIRSDRTVPYRIVEPLMVACARSGVWRVTFAVVEGGGS